MNTIFGVLTPVCAIATYGVIDVCKQTPKNSILFLGLVMEAVIIIGGIYLLNTGSDFKSNMTALKTNKICLILKM